MHDPSITGHEAVVEETTTGLNHRKMLMWLFLGSDCLFFGALISYLPDISWTEPCRTLPQGRF